MADNSTARASRELLNREIPKLIPLSVGIVITNSLVIVLFCKRKSLRTWANKPLLSLAVCDFLTGFINIPLFIITMLTSLIQNPETLHFLRYLMFVFHTLTATAVVYHILVVTAEMYLAIVWTFKHRLIKRQRMLQALAIVWLVSILIAFLPFAWMNVSNKPIGTKLFLGHEIFCLVAVFFLPYLFMIYAFITMFRAISTSSRKQPQSPALLRRNSRGKNIENHRKICTVFAIMATTFAVCWLPWFVLSLLVNLNVKNLEGFLEWYFPFRYVASITNPLLYTFFKPDFRRAFKEMLSGRFSSLHLRSTLTSRFSWQNSSMQRRFQALIKKANNATPAEPCNVQFDTNDKICFVSSV